MENNKVKQVTPVPTTTITRDLRQLDTNTNNIYESIVVISKRANQIASDIKEELHSKLADFATANDNLEEVFENLAHRDYQDTTRKESPLIRAEDAVVLDNTDMTQEEQLNFVISEVKKAINKKR